MEENAEENPNNTLENREEEANESDDEEKREFLAIFGKAYATDMQFWKAIFFSCLPQGILLALIALAFFNFYTALANATWVTHEYEHALHFLPEDSPLAVTTPTTSSEEQTHSDEEDPIHALRLGNGEWWYVGMLAGAGLAVGLIKTIWTLIVPERHAFPRKLPGFLGEIRGLHAHSVYLPLPMLICSAISIGLGASVGPEAAMGATGCALGTFLSKRWSLGKHKAVPYKKDDGDFHGDRRDPDNHDNDQEENLSCLSKLLPDFSHSEDKKLLVLDGMAAAFGALFPAQYLSPMLIFELGDHWGAKSGLSATETLARTGFSASIAYIVFVSVEEFTLLSQLQLPVAAYDVLPEIDVIHMFEACVLGIICGFIGIIGLIILGLGSALGNKTHDAFDKLGIKLGLARRRVSLGLLMTPVVGGTIVGLLCVLSPLCLSDGADQLGSIVALGKALGPGEIAVTALVKFLCLAFSVGFGFVGGPIFPFIFTGACVGTVATLVVDGIPVLVAVPACMVAVPCAFIPAIFTFATLASMILALGGAATSPVFFACICSYTTICGFGVLHDVFDRSRTSNSKGEGNSVEESGEVPLEYVDEGEPNTGAATIGNMSKSLEAEGAEVVEPLPRASS